MTAWRKGGRICGDSCYRLCRCSRWPDYVNRFGWPVRPGLTYDQQVLATNPIAYWPQSETAGLTAHCLVNPLQDGTYTGVTLADDNTGPFGTPAPFYDGTNDYCNVSTATLQAAWDAGGAEWSIMAWWKVANVGVWTDAAWRKLFQFTADANNNVSHGRSAAANRMSGVYEGGAILHSRNSNGLTSTDWNCTLITRSEAADEIRWYRDGAWLETDAVIGNWGSAAPWSIMLLGALSAVPAQPWHGWLGPVGLWSSALPLATIESLFPG